MDLIVPATVLSVSSLVNNLVSSVKSAKELAKQSSDGGLKEQIADVFDIVLDIKERVLELNEENRALRTALAQKAALKRNPEFGYYYMGDDPSPICPKCYEDVGKIVFLPPPQPWSDAIRLDCRVCESTFWENLMGPE